ncbi:helix-turn-helix domain-containing protein [Cryptosporangium minutisporangium]|uniref:Helix-turn-helix transcriptional regulator n=1 Tax=Cryptosporangium minutisporangium TaxID=113569 RepID=A0ABP6TAY7_9ACTN
MDSRDVDPVVLRRRLRAALREAREQAGLTQRDVAQEMDWSLSKLIRIESGVVTVSTNDLRALAALYRVTEDERVRTLVDMARAARRRSNWTIYSDVISAQFLEYLAHEPSAAIIRSFEPLVVPGLLQTEEYARALVSEASNAPDDNRTQRTLELRLDRQELLLGGNGPRMFFIVDEAVIRRVVGGRNVMREQLRHLVELMRSDAITLYVVPFGAGFYPLLRWPSVLLEFDDPDEPNLLYIERLTGALLTREDEFAAENQDMPTTKHLDLFFEAENLAIDQSAETLVSEAIAALEGD